MGGNKNQPYSLAPTSLVGCFIAKNELFKLVSVSLQSSTIVTQIKKPEKRFLIICSTRSLNCSANPLLHPCHSFCTKNLRHGLRATFAHLRALMRFLLHFPTVVRSLILSSPFRSLVLNS